MEISPLLLKLTHHRNVIQNTTCKGGKEGKEETEKKREERKPKQKGNSVTENTVQGEVISFKNPNQNKHWHIMHLNKYFATYLALEQQTTLDQE